MLQQTLCLIKPDATQRNLIGKIISYLENAGLKIKAIKKLQLTQAQAEKFYLEHQDKPFFASLVGFMISAPIVAIVLEGENAIAHYRELMGATNPEQREAGTIRALYAISNQENSVHGSDSETSAKREIDYFFSKEEIC
ncbi:nucleoside-diphosphate kinase [[Haemophilus] ducreyi]|uniref:Nucleoside diphosphate kinase n=2 Tax=Haemophilus ducreyi TaxID=730 RepID=NDK_HAEDU|nr:nucleoside-diphosphate kinase [[Haemophilus] ducreyi]Q7VMD0.1 RecName: Full=Nucleoside diphosphate kinase; Short=NDK; Short=NDP kinase; AltName: Full=Nucleoside-2-P kinase [[Haemophilus] ducreyi 35000HP]AAP95927.1 nucleoside diphosphate kinase [[Haemophilus] ducreyi 35000HP]AKO30936.1 nucleoside diphosphate kinase [[Haemophilus] ducreyi]AKO32375.1 nucleoside diphosphate kinase [[Haemophilus] ducreyi]AKO33827.1 nucleoside diphosphate kinase [[Haemophilus] ducreyi]AKO35273.1 nucleoside dipho